MEENVARFMNWGALKVCAQAYIDDAASLVAENPRLQRVLVWPVAHWRALRNTAIIVFALLLTLLAFVFRSELIL